MTHSRSRPQRAFLLLAHATAVGLAAFIAGCGGGGGSNGPDPSPIPKDEFPVTYALTLRSATLETQDRALPLNFDVRPTAVGASPGPAVDTVFTIEMSLSAGASWEPVTELRSTGTGRQRGIPQSTPLDLTTRVNFYWDIESDLRLAGAESGPTEVAIRVKAEQIRGPGVDFSNRLNFIVDWSSTAGCVVNTPSYQSGKSLTLTAGLEVNQQLLASGGDLPLVWSVDGVLPGTLTLDPSGALRGIPQVADTDLFITVRDSCSSGPRRDFAFVRLRVLPPECDPLVFLPNQTLPQGTVDETYDVDIRARLESDGRGSLTWRITSGTLPSGLTLTATGRISGTPADGSAGFYPITVEVTDNCSTKQRDTERFVLVIGN